MGNDAYPSARNRVAVREDSCLLSAGTASANLADASLSAANTKKGADTFASRALFLRRSHVLRLIPSSFHGSVRDRDTPHDFMPFSRRLRSWARRFWCLRI